jgi:hypothetical protein
MTTLNRFSLLFTIILFLFSCNSPKCHTIKEWETFSINGKKNKVIDTLEMGHFKLIERGIIDTLMMLNKDEHRIMGNSYYFVEDSKLIKFKKDSFKVFRIIKDGNLTIYCCAKYGCILYLSPLERIELLKIENTCSKRVYEMNKIIQLIKQDTILSPLMPGVAKHSILFN